MRIVNLIIITVATAAIILFNIIFISPLTKMAIEKSATQLVGAKVEFRSLKVDLFKMYITGKGLQVTNPDNTMKNLFEVDRIAFKINPFAALESKLVIDEASIENVRIGTSRKYDGKIIKKSKSKNKDKKEEKKIDFSSFNFNIDDKKIFNTDINEMLKKLDVDKYLKGDLKSIQAINKMKDEGTEIYQKWYKSISETKYDKDIITIANDIKKINLNYKVDPSSITKIQEDIQTIMKAKQKAESIYKDFNTKRSEFESDYKKVENNIKELDKIIKEEFNEILSKLNLKGISFNDIGNLIFSDTVMKNINLATYWFYKIRKYIPEKKGEVKDKNKKKEKKIERKFGERGYDVYFVDKTSYPDFHIKKIKLSVSGEGSDIKDFPYVSGTIYDIVSNQDLIDKPLTLELEATIPSLKDFNVKANISYDRRDEKSIDTYDIKIKNIPIENIEFGGIYGLPKKLKKSDALSSGVLKVGDDIFQLKFDIDLENISFEYDETQQLNEFSKILKDIFLSIKSLKLNVDFVYENEKPSLKIASNLDKILFDSLNRVFTQKLKGFKDDFEKKFNIKIAGSKEEMMKQLNSEKDKTLNLLKQQEKTIMEQKNIIESKLKEANAQLDSMKKKIEEDAKKKILDEGQNQLKKFF